MRLLPLVFSLTAVLAAQLPEAIEAASSKLGDPHSSSTPFRFLAGGGVYIQATTFANMALFACGLLKSSLESECLL